MKRNALPYLIIKTLIIVLLLTVAFLTSCGNNSSTPTGSSTATLSEATMCKSFNSSKGPSNITDVFSQNNWVICSVKVSDAPAGTKVKAVWLYNNEELGYSETIGVSGTKYLGFQLEAEDIDQIRFEPGDYAVKLYLNGEEKITLPFKVQ